MLENGKQLVAAGHVFNVEERQERTKSILTSKCVRATTIRETWNVELEIDQERRIVSGHCQCFAGINAKCKHGAGLFHYVNQERTDSCTDKELKWKKPSEYLKSLYPKGKIVERIY